MCISSSCIQDFDNLCTSPLKYILHLLLTSYINFLCDKMTRGHFLLLPWPFLLSKDAEFPLFSFFVCTSHSLVFVFDVLLINRTCPVSLYNLHPQPEDRKAK